MIKEEIGYMMYLELAKARSNTSFRFLLASRGLFLGFLSVLYPFPICPETITNTFPSSKLYNAPTIHASRQRKIPEAGRQKSQNGAGNAFWEQLVLMFEE